MAVPPHKTNPPLVIDPNRVLTLPIAPQGFQLIPRWGCQHPQFRRGVQLQKFSQRDPLECPEAPRVLVVKKLFGFLRSKALNHSQSIERITLYVKRSPFQVS